jgi:seryl-tRNA synthetase
MLQRGVMAFCGSQSAIWARHGVRGLRPFCPASSRVSIRSNAVAEVATTALPSVAPAFKANLDFKFVRDNLQLIADNCKLRNSPGDPARVAQLYDEFTRLKQESDSLRASRNENSAAMKVWGTADNIF